MQKAISILLAVLMLASSTGVTYAKHFCGDYEVLSTITFGEKSLSCGMSMDSDNCDDDKQEPIDCCKNKYNNVDTDDNFAKTSFNLHLNAPFVASFVAVFIIQQVEINQQAHHLYADYDPPPLDEEITILHQVFII
jgi:hypothetical protein